MAKKLKKEIEDKLEAKIQEVVLAYDPMIGKKLKKSIANASESIAKKAFKYLTREAEKAAKARGQNSQAKGTKTESAARPQEPSTQKKAKKVSEEN